MQIDAFLFSSNEVQSQTIAVKNQHSRLKDLIFVSQR